MWTISIRWTFVEHSVSALFKKKSLVSILRKFLKPWGSSSDNSFTKAWWAPCFLCLWIQARTHFFLWHFFLCILWRTLAIIIMHKEIIISSSWSYILCTQWQENSGKWNWIEWVSHMKHVFVNLHLKCILNRGSYLKSNYVYPIFFLMKCIPET